ALVVHKHSTWLLLWLGILVKRDMRTLAIVREWVTFSQYKLLHDGSSLEPNFSGN
ncbi:hypothetical protein BD410DRAFT_793556, partial [Rickenella mellea]